MILNISKYNIIQIIATVIKQKSILECFENLEKKKHFNAILYLFEKLKYVINLT